MQPTHQSERTPSSAEADDDIILRELILNLWKGRWWVIAVTCVCAVAGGAASFTSPKKYEAHLLLSPVTNQPSSGSFGALSSAVSQIGGIASLGLSMGGTGGAKAEALATLESEALTERYIKENDLLPVLFSSSWDPQKMTWKNADQRKLPTLWQGNLFFARAVRFVRDTPKTGLVTLSITWTDPARAAQWANGLVKMTNDYLREKAIKESDRNISYLNEQLTKTSVVELRNSIYLLMESEIKKQMIARGSEEYALKVIDPAETPERASSPQRILWALAGLCVGLLLSLSYVFIRAVTKSVHSGAAPRP
jgi:uncharacterized protein involved in exopolysaccharide biosynthesis